MRYNLHLVRPGQRYGRRNALLNERTEPLLEFYDAEYAGDPRFDDLGPGGLGQFVSRYLVSTLRQGQTRTSESGLNLQGDVPEWQLSGAQMREIFAWLDRQRV